MVSINTLEAIHSKLGLRKPRGSLPRSFFTPKLPELLDSLLRLFHTALLYSDMDETELHDLLDRVEYVKERFEKLVSK